MTVVKTLVQHAARCGLRTMLFASEGFSLTRPARALNQFATHIPVLIGIAQLFPISSVLELGSGTYSTLTFLNRNSFPDLIRLDSFETNAAWGNRLSAATAGDPRITIRVVPDPIESSMQSLRLADYDLIFVDHSMSFDTRAATIRWLAGISFGSAIIVLHDYEMPQYRDAARGFPHRFEFAAFTPATAVAWSAAPLRRSSLRVLGRAIKRHACATAPDDVYSWSTLLAAEFRGGGEAAG